MLTCTRASLPLQNQAVNLSRILENPVGIVLLRLEPSVASPEPGDGALQRAGLLWWWIQSLFLSTRDRHPQGPRRGTAARGYA